MKTGISKDPPRLVLELDPAESIDLLGALKRVEELLAEEAPRGSTGVGAVTSALEHLAAFRTQVGLELGHLLNVNPPTHITVVVPEVNMAPSGERVGAGPSDVPPIPPEHAEWAVRVFRADLGGNRHADESMARTFDREARARDFFTRTQNVWNARVRNKEAPAYVVVLGVQDARKHRKKGSFRELEAVLCKG